MSNFEQRLDRLAEVAIRVGLQLQKGQELVITSPVEALPLVRRITAHAYKAGCVAGDAAVLGRRADACCDLSTRPTKASTRPAAGCSTAWRRHSTDGAARLAVVGEDPSLLSAQDPEKVARVNRARSAAYRPALERVVNFDINWNIVSYRDAGLGEGCVSGRAGRRRGAAFVGRDLCRLAGRRADPIAEWKRHNEALSRRTAFLNEKRYYALRFKGPETDLTVGLADDHWWEGGASTAKNGVTCNPNIPTEEVFTTPHMARVEGVVRSTKPLSYQGTLIQDIAVRFEGGRIVQSSARTGADVLAKVLTTDEGAARLGEVALVPHSSPISKSGVLFLNTLFDENAASHIALGQAYSKCIRNGTNLTPQQLAEKGANKSLIHIDWMIGSDKIDVDGITANGSAEPLMRGGEWV